MLVGNDVVLMQYDNPSSDDTSTITSLILERRYVWASVAVFRKESDQLLLNHNQFLIKCKARYRLQSTEPKGYANEFGISSERFGLEQSWAQITSEQHKGRRTHVPQPDAEIRCEGTRGVMAFAPSCAALQRDHMLDFFVCDDLDCVII